MKAEYAEIIQRAAEEINNLASLTPEMLDETVAKWDVYAWTIAKCVYISRFGTNNDALKALAKTTLIAYSSEHKDELVFTDVVEAFENLDEGAYRFLMAFAPEEE